MEAPVLPCHAVGRRTGGVLGTRFRRMASMGGVRLALLLSLKVACAVSVGQSGISTGYHTRCR